MCKSWVCARPGSSFSIKPGSKTERKPSIHAELSSGDARRGRESLGLRRRQGQRYADQCRDHTDEHETLRHLHLRPATQLEVVMERGHPEQPPSLAPAPPRPLEIGGLEDH